MSATLHIHDETVTGAPLNELTLEFLTERIDVRELIRSRVYQEVKDYNVKLAQGAFRGLVEPEKMEAELNQPHDRSRRQIDWKRQFEIALEAFGKNGFLILVNDRQAERLNEPIELRPDTRVSFVKLTPLVGG